MEFSDDDFVVHTILYTCISCVFAMAVLSKFYTNELRFGFRSILSLLTLLVGEPLCHFIIKGNSGISIFAVSCLFIYSVLPASHMPSKNKIVVITGCDSGFGHATARKLDSIGMKVFACCLDPEGSGAEELRLTSSRSLKVLKLDLRKEDDIRSVVRTVKEETCIDGLWGLVNNAGVFHLSEIELMPDTLMKEVVEINLMGPLRLTRALLPLIRQSKGRIVNISSVAGSVCVQGLGLYSMTKAALNHYTNTLRLEMKKWSVHVAVVQPSGFKTGSNTDETCMQRQLERIWSELDETVQTDYGYNFLEMYLSNLASSMRKCSADLSPVVRAVRSALLSNSPRNVYPCGTGARLVTALYPLLPRFVSDYFSGVFTPHNTRPLAIL